MACEESGAHLSNLRAHNEELETSLAKQRDATAAAEADRDAKEVGCFSSFLTNIF